MYKLLFSFCIFSASLQAYACQVFVNSSNPSVLAVTRQYGWGFKDYEVVCAKLQRANAALVVSGHATVLSNKSIAWAAVGLKDRGSSVHSHEHGGLSTTVNDDASMDVATKLLMESINDAIDKINLDRAIDSLNEGRRQVKSAITR